MLNHYNIPGWIDLELVSWPIRYVYIVRERSVQYFQDSPGQSQMFLKNSERFALLLAENLEAVGLSQTIESENISENLYLIIIAYI